ncbi:MAG TPA: hypothetical protein PK184_11175 [Phycisphaerae bacterium]|mgnify:CR=1 FL=1|jgi:hypothetical protein|nr:hypothetical protein [Phycisphaerae bacterium]HOJ54970.1 hypothetical protein [Phycisphaerae bacterium]HOL27008.1 hypothetical protein [Phycisphaerae bacterium]HPP21437.1 hypothetical protein [Phycisphaerae bacterium]HPU33248.1 hypothetical protein [Phycisphaerae bacterium]
MSLRPRKDNAAGRVRTGLLLLFLLAAGLRVGWVLVRWGPEGRAEHLDYPDEEAYVLSARSLAAGEGLIDEFGYRATYMPGYPAFLAIFQGLPRPLLWARIAQALLAAWVAPATFLLARQFLAGRPGQPGDGALCHDSTRSADGAQPVDGRPCTGTADAAVMPARESLLIPGLAGLGAAFDPFLVFFSGLLLTEALFAAVLVTAWIFMQKHPPKTGRGWFAEAICAGLFLWLAIMLRPSAAILVVLTPVALVVLRRFDRKVVVQAAVIPLVVIIGLLPWAARNRAVIGRWHWLSTRGGISLYDGLQPGATGGSDLAHTKEAPDVQGLGEVQWNEYFQERALAEARRDPMRVLRLAWRKFLRTWSPIPNVEEYSSGFIALVSAAWMLPALGFAAIGWWRCRRPAADWLLLLLPVIAFTLLHMIYVGSVRYRVPVMPFVVVLSAAGLGAVAMLFVGRGRAPGGRASCTP